MNATDLGIHHPSPTPRRLDAYYEIGLGGCWDLCAAVLVLVEAGGRVLDPAGKWRRGRSAACLVQGDWHHALAPPRSSAGACPERPCVLSALPTAPSSLLLCVHAGGPFNIMSRRVLGANAHLAEKAAAALAPIPLAPGEPQPQPLP